MRQKPVHADYPRITADDEKVKKSTGSWGCNWSDSWLGVGGVATKNCYNMDKPVSVYAGSISCAIESDSKTIPQPAPYVVSSTVYVYVN